MILVDSSVWIDYFNGNKTSQTNWLDSSLGNTPIIIGDLILTEVLQGFQSSQLPSAEADGLRCQGFEESRDCSPNSPKRGAFGKRALHLPWLESWTP